MAATVDVTSVWTNSATTSRSHLAGASPTHAYLFIMALANDEQILTAATYAGAAMSLIGEFAPGAFNPNIQIWEKIAPAGGTQTVGYTPIVGGNVISSAVVTVNGGHASNGATVGADGSGTSVTVSSTVATTTGDLILQNACWMNGTASSAQSGTNLTQVNGQFNLQRGSVQSQTGNGSVASTLTITSAAWGAISISVPQAAAGGLKVNPLSGRGGAAAQPLVN